ncbi:hypothetical protein [Stenotrophomonas sp. AS1]|uniref:hypothetical protein n=1 Tax=Stenotrophomonas sp. AS1 TaxID=3029188 RepID=UPI003B767413
MRMFKLLFAAATACVFGVGCSTPSVQTAVEPTALESQLVGALVVAAEREGQLTKVLLTPNLSPGIKSAAAAMRPAVLVASGEIEGLRKGELLVQSATLGESHATIEARLGPVPPPKPNTARLACGTGLTVTFNKVGGEWQQGDLQLLNC